MNVKFIIRNMDADSPQAIYVSARFGRNSKLMYATPQKVLPMYWDAEHGRVRLSRYFPAGDRINEALEELRNKISAHSTEILRGGGELTKDTMREFLDIHFGKKKGKALCFHDFYQRHVENVKTRMNEHRGGQNITKKTWFEYTRTLLYINMYEAERGRVIDFPDIDQDFLADFAAFLQAQNLATNTIAHKIICIKAVMRSAMEHGLTTNDRWRYYHNATEQTEAVALSEEELGRLSDYDFTESPRLERVRDLFLAGCWTGLRFSDITRIRQENISDGIISIVQSKTNEKVSVPVHPVFQEIWEKYGGRLPSGISNQRFNSYIKEVCRKVGLTDRVLKSITKGGRKITTMYEKWQLVSSHTARRSFATNLYRSGFPAISIMQITGHKTEAAFLKYIKVGKDEHARILAEHWAKKRGL